MPSDPECFKGIILKSSEYKEKDRLISVLTKERGIISVMVKGVGGKTSKLSFVSVPFSYCDFVVTFTHNFYYLKEGSVISANTGIMNSLEAMAVAGHISECLTESVMQSDNAPACYELAIYAYYMLSEYPSAYLSCLCIFNWKLMWLLGLAADASECKDTVREGKKLSKRSCDILDFIGKNTVSKDFAQKLEENDIRELRKFTLSYMSAQFEKEIPDPVYKLNLPETLKRNTYEA